ncbi:hypothetical protein C1S82_21480 [Mycolicibacterium cosmeticum]|nr:hypothetical protein C1S82_21480 [Mycolicibacterium cosmeticum]
MSVLTAAGSVATVALLTQSAPAGADTPAVGSDCASAQIGDAATGPDGAALRCMADDQGKIHWLPDTHAVSTIADLQASGYSVTVDRSGNSPLIDCKVVEVHNPMTVTSTNYGGTSPGGPGSHGDKHQTTIVVSKTIDVTLDCTGG